MRQIVLDTETTGLRTEEGDRIIEIGCIELINRKITGKRYHQYLNPQKNIHAEALAVHGLTNQFLETKPLFTEIVDDLLMFIGDSELIIHNAPFDIGFLDYELNLLRKNYKPMATRCRIFDTLTFARQLYIGQRNSLDALCKRLAIDNSNRELHGALLDANLLAQVYLAMTGGQGCLFDKIAHLEPNIEQTISNQVISTTNIPRKLKVLKATLEELSLHDDQLSKIKKCLWLVMPA